MNIQELSSLIGNKERVITEHIPKEYQSDILGRMVGKAEAVIKVVSTDEVSRVLKYAYEHQIPVTPRGAGTNLVGSTVPDQGGIVIDLSLMNHILEVDVDTMTATVEPGILLQDFQQDVEKMNLFYPPDPGEKKSTIGGNISTNAGGMRAVKYGVTKDYVMGLEVVLADGTVMNLGSKNRKDSSGLGLKNLIPGSEGTLAIITKCILKVIPKPEYSVSAVIPYASLQTGIENVLTIQHQNVTPTALEFVERKVVSIGEKFLNLAFPFPDADAYIIVTIDGKEQEVKSDIELIRETVLNNGAKGFKELSNPEDLANVWKIRGALVKAVESVSEQEPIDIVVPINRVADFVEYVNELQQETGMQMISFGHAGDGNVHLCVVRDGRTEEQWIIEKKENLERLYQKAYELGGLTSGEHGIGLSKRPYFLKESEQHNLELMRRVKYAFDTKGILNNRKSYL